MNCYRAVTAGTIIDTPRDAALTLIAAEPGMSGIVVIVLTARRRAMLESRISGLTVVGSADDRAVRALVAFAAQQGAAGAN